MRVLVERLEPTTSWLLNSSQLVVARSQIYPDGVLNHHVLLVITHLWLTSHLRGKLFLLDTGTPCTGREDAVRMLTETLEPTTLRLQSSRTEQMNAIL